MGESILINLNKMESKMKYPTYLQDHIKDLKDKFLSTMTLCSSSGDENLEIYYYGELVSVKGEKQKYITSGDKPMKVVAKFKEEEFVIFDAALYGYDNMFCNTYTKEQIENRPLKKLNIQAEKFILELGYSIDYDDETELYEYDEQKNVVLIDGRSIDFEDMKRDAYDYLSLCYLDKNGELVQFVDEELA